MKPLIAILTYSGANSALEWLRPWHCLPGCDLLYVGRSNSECTYPRPPKGAGYRAFYHAFGNDSYVKGANQAERLINLWEVAFGRYRDKYSSLCVTEWDSIFTGPLPALHPGGLFCKFGGQSGPPFHGTRFLQVPWWSDWPTTDLMAEYGRRMLKTNLLESGWPDRWLGLLADLYDIPVSHTNTFHCNTIDNPNLVARARESIPGCFMLHGIKTKETLDAVTEGYREKLLGQADQESLIAGGMVPLHGSPAS